MSVDDSFDEENFFLEKNSNVDGRVVAGKGVMKSGIKKLQRNQFVLQNEISSSRKE